MNIRDVMAYGTSEGVKKEWQSRGKKSVFDQHQIRIAKKTLLMPDAMVGVMGGPDKAEARAILKKHGIKFNEDSSEEESRSAVGPG